MKKKIKKIFYGCLSLVVILAIWIMVGSIDSADYDDLGLLDHVVNIPKEQNGYREIAYLHNENEQLHQYYEISKKIMDHLHHKEWDDNFVQQVLDKHKQHIDSALAATKYKFFRFPERKDAGNFIIAMPELYISRLIILKSMTAAKVGNFSEAIMLVESAVIFSQQIKNNGLISYTIGLLAQYDPLSWVHYLAVNYELNEMQYANIANIFHQIKAYKEYSFSQVFYKEYASYKNILETLMKRTFIQRWDDYLSFRESKDDEYFFEDVFSFFQVIFPRYYTHKNRALSQAAQQNARFGKDAENYCDNLALEDPVAAQERHSILYYMITPNSASEFYAAPGLYDSVVKDIYLKRCFSHAYTEGIKTIVALKRFQLKTGKLPDSLVELLPNYLKALPIDPFNGDTLNYAKEKMWLYSVGDNFEDNGGSKKSFYTIKCRRNPLCSKNPTFSMHPQHR